MTGWRARAVRLLAVWIAILLGAGGTAWAQGVGQFLSPGPLAEDHKDLEGLSHCNDCHSLGRGIGEDRCMACHDSVAAQVRDRTGYHANKGQNCERCHPDHLGRDYPLVRILESDFDHDATGLPLRGAHAEIACADCHTEPGTWKGLQTACASCHDDPHGADVSERDLLGDCSSCHDSVAWDRGTMPESFDHNAASDADYPLEHAHAEVACAECHPSSRFVPVVHDSCEDCHGDPHTVDFAPDCAECHPTADTFMVDAFAHAATGFVIEGLHERLVCRDCHGSRPARSPGKPLCATCHDDVHNRQFGAKDCGSCHTVFHAGFAVPDFDHTATAFPLVGEHRTIGCDPCHGDGPGKRYRGVPHADCDDCHTDAHEGRYEPVKCNRCHTPDAFDLVTFSHDDTSFPHTGSHVGLPCEECHEASRWSGLAHDSCADCHADASPHQGFDPARCEGCHQTTRFADMAFNHVQATGFDLSPAHQDQACVACHDTVVDFSGRDPACRACHAAPTSGHYPGACEGCHPSAHWSPGELGGHDHAVTGFTLHGMHGTLDCDACHTPGAPRGLAQAACVSCHAQDDPHRHGLGNVCEDCHASGSWFRTRFRHSTTGWPLRGSHKLVDCESCHAAGYVGTPTACWRCHAADADPLTPAHQSAYFPLCDSCHRPFGWDLPRYPHR